MILDRIAPPAQGIVFEVQDLEAGVQGLDEVGDLERAREIG